MLHAATKQQAETQPFDLARFSFSGEARSYAMLDTTRSYWTPALSPLTALTEPDELIGTWQQAGEATTILTAQQIDSLERLYAFRRREEVVNFLSDNPFLAPLLQDARPQIETYFRSYTQLILEVVTDPEAVDDRELVLFIQTDLPPEEALASLDQLDDNWWLEASRASRGKLCIHVE